MSRASPASKAAKALATESDELMAHFELPGERWKHLQEGPVESTFATVKLRQRVTQVRAGKRRWMLVLKGPTAEKIARKRAWVTLGVSIAILGCHWPIMRIGLKSIGPGWFAVLRLVFAAIGYAAALLIQGRLIWFTRRDVPMVVGLGVFQMTFMIGLVTYGVGLVGAGRAAILCYTTPLWVIPGAAIFLRERIDKWRLLGVIIGIAGMIELFNPNSFEWGDGHVVVGSALIIAGALSWSAAIIQVRSHKWDSDALQLLPYQSLIGAVLLYPVAGLLEGWVPHIEWSGEFVAAFSFTAFIASCVGYWGAVAAGRILPASSVSLAQLATPVIGYSTAALWIGEAPSGRDVLGLVLILTGVGTAALGGGNRAGG